MAKSADDNSNFIPDAEMELSPNARIVLESRYLRRDDQGRILETPAQMFWRVAGHIAKAETAWPAGGHDALYWQKRFYEMMVSRRFLPNSPTLMNAGRTLGMLSACFVLPLPDSIEGIFDTVKATAVIQKAGGGTGFSLDNLRPTGDYIASSGGHTSGPISFWKVLSETTNAIQQGAFRRGANMAMMSLWHPDILKFIHAKRKLSLFSNYNISVKATDEWMQTLLAHPEKPHIVRNPRTGKQYYLPADLEIDSYELSHLVPVDAASASDKFWTVGQIWRAIIENAHHSGEPGLAFIDRINRDNPTPHLGTIQATNPCGEQPLLDYESCNLGSINLSRFVPANAFDLHLPVPLYDAEKALALIDWTALAKTIFAAVRFLANVVAVNNYQLPQIEQISRANRKIGLGVMGFADLLFQLAVPYNCDTGVEIARRLMQFLQTTAHQASESLAQKRGSFPNWKGSRWDAQFHRSMRNAAVTTIAPTGTLSILAGCTSGIEPLFSPVFIRQILDGKKLPEIHHFVSKLGQNGAKQGKNSAFQNKNFDTIGKTGDLGNLPDDLKKVFVCAYDIDPNWHVSMQAAFQQHCDSAVSKTINLPETASLEEVDEVYRLAYQLDCKGITVFRDNCRPAQPMRICSDTACD